MGVIREFKTGATRNTDEGKHDYYGFISVQVLRAFGAYMYKHRTQADGTIRPSDNWKKGLPPEESIRSAYRHFLDVVQMMDEGKDYLVNHTDELVSLNDAICAVIFNMQSILHERLKDN